jgi:hypothetical protein
MWLGERERRERERERERRERERERRGREILIFEILMPCVVRKSLVKDFA